MKCFYRLVLEDKQVIDYFVPESLKKTNQDIFYFDYFAYMCGNMEELCDQLTKLTGNKKKVVKVSIDYKRDKNNKDHNPYNVVFDNPYLDRLMENNGEDFSSVRIKDKVRVLGNRNIFDKKVLVVDTESAIFKDMEKFVFNFLQKDKDTFFKSVYTRKNDYATVMNQYAVNFEQEKKGNLEPEDYSEFAMKKAAIKEHLSKYRIFRSMAICRYEYEQKMERKAIKEFEKNYDPFDTGLRNVRLEDYNKDNEEYLDEDEYNSMASGDTVYYSGRR